MQIQIRELERNLSDGTVTAVHWSATVQDGEHSANAVGVLYFERDENSATFIPFNDLTETKIIEWVKAEWNSVETEWESPEDTLKAEVAKLKTPTKANGVPW